jgi:parallel beta-helix repeat protein
MAFRRRNLRATLPFRLALATGCGLVVLGLSAPTDLSGSARAAAAAHVSCSLYASPSGSNERGSGSRTHPLRTARHLVGVLAPGQTGCLMSGTYRQSPGLTFEHGGSAGKPITLSSAPGQTATLAGGYIYLPAGSNYVTLENLHITGVGTTQQSVQIFASHDSLVGDDITNGAQHASCIIIGYPGDHPYPTDTLIEDDVIHQCGSTADGNQDQAIYLSQSQNATVTDNIIWGNAGFAIHLYPDSDGNQITHNVIDDNGYGVIFGSARDGGPGSSRNTVAYNIVADSTAGPNASESWGGLVGTGNVYDNNCDDNGPGTSGQDVATPDGFTAAGDIYGSPGFTDESAHTITGYELGSASPCLAVVGHDTAALLLAGAMPLTGTGLPLAGPPVPQPSSAMAIPTHHLPRRPGRH